MAIRIVGLHNNCLLAQLWEQTGLCGACDSSYKAKKYKKKKKKAGEGEYKIQIL